MIDEENRFLKSPHTDRLEISITTTIKRIYIKK